MNELLTVVETRSYLVAAKNILSEKDRVLLVDMIAQNPRCGDIIEGAGGVRKVRFALGNRGKSAGARVVYFFYNENHPAYLLTVFAKNEKANLTKAERNALSVLVKELVA